MKKNKPYEIKEPENLCAREPVVGYIDRQHLAVSVSDEMKDGFEQLWERGMEIEEFRVQTKQIIKERAVRKYGKK